MATAETDQDTEERQAVQRLLELKLESQSGKEVHMENGVGSFIAQADRGSAAMVDIDQPWSDRD